ncbi:MAG: hypothetical protein JAZ19_03735 [Candidatus Thiodiazotropha taylori]|nr:hypothetical protein [Candidatus Thiodiazotropha taylori]
MEDNIYWLFEAQKSSEFTNLLQLVSETEIDGELKFTPSISRELGRLLVCRAYAPTLLELSHLVVMAQQCSPTQPDALERFFWDSGPARPNVFRAYIEKQLKLEALHSGGFSLSNDAVCIKHQDIDFCITYSRMPLLSALMEFLVTSLGYRILDDVLQLLSSQPLSKKLISDTANQLSRLLYDFLKSHLPTVQTQKNFNHLIGFLKSTYPRGFDQNSINDDLLLNFWKESSDQVSENNGDFKTFSSVYQRFVQLYRSLEHVGALRNLTFATSIGNDRDAGEIDPGDLLEHVEQIESSGDLLDTLQSPPAESIKFLNNREHSRLDRLIKSGHIASKLPLSLLRSEVFEPQRTRLTQALRDKVDKKRITMLIEEGPEEDYNSRFVLFEKDKSHIEQVRYASLYVLLQAEHHSAIELALALNPDLDLHHLNTDNNPAPDALLSSFFKMATKDSKVETDLSKLADTAYRAFKKIARKGFHDDEISQTDIIDGFAVGSDVLNNLKSQIDTFLQTASQKSLPNGDWTSQFSGDRQIFAKQFHKLYVEAERSQTSENSP